MRNPSFSTASMYVNRFTELRSIADSLEKVSRTSAVSLARMCGFMVRK